MSCACGCKTHTLTDEQKQILEEMAKFEKPCGSKEIVAATGLESKVVSSKISAMKKNGLVDSPVRCKYAITDSGKSALKS